MSSDLPAHRSRVMSGAGDEESFETKDSPPAVAGPLAAPRTSTTRTRAPHTPPHRPVTAIPVAGPATADDNTNQDLLLDLVSGADSLADSLRRLVTASVQSVIRTARLRIECGVVVHQPKKSPAITGTSEEVVRLLQWEQRSAEGPVSGVLAGGQPVAVLQRNGDFRWPRYCDQLKLAGFGSVLGVRLPLTSAPMSTPCGSTAYGNEGPGRDTSTGPREAPAALAFFAQDAKAFPLQVIAEARAFAGLAAKSLQMAMDLHAARSMASDLRSALDSRTSINVACGVIMAQNRCSYHEAFAILARASSHRNIKVRRIAEDILERLPEGAPQAHFGH